MNGSMGPWSHGTIGENDSNGVAMKKIAILAQKGGVGKSSICAHLSTMTGGKTALIDTDRQSSIGEWIEQRESEEPLFFSYSDFANYGLPAILKRAAAAGCEYAVIDCPPHSDSTVAMTIPDADVIVIPCEPAFFPLKAMGPTLEMARATGKPIILVLNKVFPREAETQESIDALLATELPLVVIQRRVAFVRAIPFGKTVKEFRTDPDAIREMDDLWSQVEKALNQ